MFRRFCGNVYGAVCGFTLLILSPFIAIGRFFYPGPPPKPEFIPGPEDDVALFDDNSQQAYGRIKDLRLAGRSVEANKIAGQLKIQAWIARGDTDRNPRDGTIALPSDLLAQQQVVDSRCTGHMAEQTFPARDSGEDCVRISDNSNFPAFLEKVHAEGMATPEGLKVQAAETEAIAEVVAAKAAGKKAELPRKYQRVIPVNSYRGREGL